MTAPICELFSSLQGEGILVGVRQLFLRFAGCNLRCDYCDTQRAWERPEFARVERTPGARDWEQTPPEMTPEQAAARAQHLLRLAPAVHHSIALTGGEPLLHADFLRELLPLLGEMGLRCYLETNGTLADELAGVIAHLDFIAADVKLPSATMQPPLWGAHERFLVTMAGHEDANRTDFVKIVYVHRTSEEEVERAARLIAGINPNLPLVLQPATMNRIDFPEPLPSQGLQFQAAALRHLGDVRVIPQMHKLGGWL